MKVVSRVRETKREKKESMEDARIELSTHDSNSISTKTGPDTIAKFSDKKHSTLRTQIKKTLNFNLLNYLYFLTPHSFKL